MNNKEKVLDAILSQGMLPLFFYEDAEVSFEIIRTMYNAGVRAVEYTNRGKEALSNFYHIKQRLAKDMPDVYLGIGTIKTGLEAEAFVEAGADFIVSPIVDNEVALVADNYGKLWVPGCMTPTEIHIAQQYKAKLIKIFPANILGPAFIASIRDLFPGQLFVPTGGVEIEAGNIAEWFRSGVCAVGMGSKLISRNVLDKRLYTQLYNDTLKALELVQLSK
ncbi:bifunctional 4-hydroxy-2-oxoglutarate aldolase/2-dehydro-3-deoxy-phosphogluconate aldolase [Mucilaginibacter phyllosphaerae]|uniref:2-dehydro-3-deoxyphosphogluconate aldolase/(4S)-4-hydroxy-2-oxoglutarate aldolase n=1 Tax=Mucilaginibacter phyllosphaerae TaxID=1812349 RepID=A0A4Y8AHW8_9SPHI|nr:bifunctional 4-hydroxy-2-oxoglutarate aldolase/2-dehydro-3-deoxy-phosphogluconate aldolase [Mucilaginibacter phyllosphaerae]MBB3968323.1 2-dehydro-3-deoxyphosphogluconate aldolase/(4S)-4-hydroxy-2-oxoglutarate aldolase [Mucilaginibacter phyllosphaerae]TEW68678.1 bifunctional 4-hydroxy-2-oxoglutarate aldolase/2-dehydro-3-deoxy-phosphogluconate aldolase [Mucilaginibacter phyllosphaerae]GGG99719.1 bifunctional 4-hydroxy-2-oxoglutarate aldolase/2-dehydro-3-deoxy-phosphogluconate aldolase [Mucilag